MTKQEFLRELVQILDASPGTIRGDEPLDQLSGWDSMAALSLIAMADAKLGLSLSGEGLAKCATAADLMRLCHITDNP